MPFVQGKGQGITFISLDMESGAMVAGPTIPAGPNPSYLAVDSKNRNLYTTNELPDAECALKSFRFTAEGAVEELTTVSSRGVACCHLLVDPSDRFVLAVNYTSGSIVLAARAREDGHLEACTGPTAFAPFDAEEATRVNPERQEHPHAHQAAMFPTYPNRVFVPDLGCDCVRVFALDDGRLQCLEPIVLPPGSGPRHVVAHPHLKILYVVTELANTVCVVYYSASTVPRVVQVISTLPEGFTGESYCAALRITATGSHLYAANRIHDSIAVLEVAADGTLVLMGCEPVGKCPRDFNIVEGMMVVACQNSDELMSLCINPMSGRLTHTGHVLPSPTPVAVLPII